MFYKKNYKNKLFYISLLFILISISFNFTNYIGNKFLFLIFNISALCLFLTVIRKNASAFEFFFAAFLLLSFWFKFSCILYFENIKVTEGNFDLGISNYDKSTVVIIFSFFGFVIGSYLSELILKKFSSFKKFEIRSYFLRFYENCRFYILFFFLIFFTFTCLINIYYNIYNRGLINENIPILIKYFFSWAFTYGLATITSILIYIDFFIFKDKKYFILSIFESIFSNISIFSRGFILSIWAYVRGFIYLGDHKKMFSSNTSFYKLVLSCIILFLIIFYIVGNLRNINFVKKEYYKPISIENVASEFLYLSINRWVGIDGLLSVSQNENLSFEFFKSSLTEKKTISKRIFLY